MRSYEAARSLFSVLSVCAWVAIVGGVILAVMLGSLANENIGRGMFVFGMIPGLILGLAGFLGLALAQMGRAGVDSAEYGQQMLKVARDQLDISTQTLRQGEAIKTGFEALRTGSAQPPGASYASLTPGHAASPSEKAAAPAPKTIAYKDREIVVLENGYRFAGMEFAALETAQAYIDGLGVNPNARLAPAS